MGSSETWRVWWARLLPVLGIAAGAYCGFPFVAFLPSLALSLLLLLAITTAIALRFDSGGSVISGPLLAGVTGAWIGTVAARLWVEGIVRNGHSSTSVLGFFALSWVVPFAMIYFGTLSWGLASLLRVPTAPRPRTTLAGFWVPLVVTLALLVPGGLEIRAQRQWTAGRAAAESPATPPAELARLASNPDLKRYVARNPTTPEATLRTLAEDPQARAGVAANPSAPAELLTRLAEVDDAQVRVAWNISTPPTSLRALAASGRLQVREAVASNAHTPPDVLAALANDEEQRVRVAAESALERRRPPSPPPPFPPVPAAEPR